MTKEINGYVLKQKPEEPIEFSHKFKQADTSKFTPVQGTAIIEMTDKEQWGWFGSSSYDLFYHGWAKYWEQWLISVILKT